MKKRVTTLLILALLLSFLDFCTRRPDGNALIKINNTFITVDEFFRFVPRDRFFKLNKEQREERVMNFAKERLMLYDAYKKQYNKDKEVIKRVNSYREEVLVNSYFDYVILDSIINEELLTDLYRKLGTEIRAYRILISFKGSGASGSSKDESYNRAMKVYEMATSGIPFNELVKKYSDDKTTEDGDLGYISIGRMEPELEDFIFSLKIGEISQPILTKRGYQIIKVADIRSRELPEYEDYKNYLKRIAIDRHRKEIDLAYKSIIEKTKNRYELKLHKDEIGRLLSNYITNLEKLIGEKGQHVKPVTVLESIELNEVLISYKGGKFDKKWLIKQLEEYPERAPSDLSNPHTFNRYLENLILKKIFIEKAISIGLDKKDNIAKALKYHEDRMVLNRYKQVEIGDKVDLSDEKLKSYYEEQKNKRYLEPPAAEVQEIYISDKELAERVLKLALKGENFDSLAKRYTERLKNKNGYLGYITDKQYLDIGKIAQTLEPGTIYKELIPSGKGYSIIKILNRRPEQPKPYESIKSSVSSDYIKDERNRIESELFEKLKSKYKMEVYFENIKSTDKYEKVS